MAYKKKRLVQIPENPTEAQQEKLRNKAYNYALWHLDQSMKTEKQIVDLMIGKGYTEEYIGPAIEKCKKYDLINDAEYAHSFIRSRKSIYGRRRIEQDLLRKGVQKDTIDSLIEDEIDPEDAREDAKDLAERRLRTTQGLERQKRVQRVLRVLVTKGYDMSMAYSVINEVLAEEELETEESTD